MTLLSEALAEARAADTASVERRESVERPRASDEAMRLALSLREIRPRSGGRMMLFVPAADTSNASYAAADAAAGLLDLHDGPVLLMDLRDGDVSATTSPWVSALPVQDPNEPWGGERETSASVVVMRPFARRRDSVAYAASPDFAALLAEMRARYPYVLCIGAGIPASVETLVVAATVDGVVLSVPPNRLTRSAIQRTVEQLRRARAPLVGFVVDGRDGEATTD